MTKFSRLSFVVAAAALLSAIISPAAVAASYVLEKPHTQILFFANHLGFSTSSGRFLEFDGQFTFDQADWAASSAEITIQTDSLEMNHAKWNDHMKNEDFFDVPKYPTMTFKSTSVEPLAGGKAKLHGDLTILGQTHPITLDVSFNGTGNHPFKADEIRAGFELRGSIDRSKYGMVYGIPAVGKNVELRISVEGIQQ